MLLSTRLSQIEQLAEDGGGGQPAAEGVGDVADLEEAFFRDLEVGQGSVQRCKSNVLYNSTSITADKPGAHSLAELQAMLDDLQLGDDPACKSGSLSGAADVDFSHTSKGDGASAAVACPVSTPCPSADHPSGPLPDPSTATPTPDIQAALDALDDLTSRPATAPTPAPLPLHVRFRLAQLQSRPVAALPSLPAWRKLSALQIFTAGAYAAAASEGLALTLNLSPKIEAAARAHPDPIRYLTGRLNHHLRKGGIAGLPYAITLEISPNGRLHAHGYVISGDLDHVMLRRVLRGAGGKLAVRSRCRQTDLRTIFDPAGWNGYLSKAVRQTRRALPTVRHVFVSETMKRIVRTYLEQRQAKATARRQVKASPATTTATQPAPSPTTTPAPASPVTHQTQWEATYSASTDEQAPDTRRPRLIIQRPAYGLLESLGRAADLVSLAGPAADHLRPVGIQCRVPP